MEFIKHNLLLIAVAAVSGTMLLWPLLRRGAGGPWVSTVEATQLINRSDALVLDVREAGEFAQGHVLGSKNLPLGELERRAPELDRHKAKPVILLCATGQRSGRAQAALKARGFGAVYNLSGGFGAWLQAGLPVEK